MMKLVYKADNIAEAQIVKGMLEASGIEAYAGGYFLQGGVGEIPVMDFANIEVEEEDYARAREIIQEYEAKRPPPSKAPDPGAAKAASGARLLITVIAVMMLTALFLFLATR